VRRTLLLLGLFAIPAAAEQKPSGPVVVELFSSEGCSSCPPADEVLRALDADGRSGNVSVIALELHVDYWNDLGWADPFSRPEWTARQRAYAAGKSGTYTPQAVIDGNEELVGSREAALREAIARASMRPHLAVTIARDGESIVVRVPAGGDERADVLLAITDRNLSTVVPRGENAGRTLRHGPIVREMRALGVFSGSTFEARSAAGAATRRSAGNWVALVQGQKSRRILGSAAL